LATKSTKTTKKQFRVFRGFRGKNAVIKHSQAIGRLLLQVVLVFSFVGAKLFRDGDYVQSPYVEFTVTCR